MLETDCTVPTAFVPIEQPETYTLYGIDHAVYVMRKQGLRKWQICKYLHIDDDAWRDAIFEIRKKEMIEDMARGKRLTEEQVKRIRMLRQAGATLDEIAADTGCAKSCVSRHLGEKKLVSRSQDASECAQSASAAAAMIMPQTVPDAVTDAVCARIDALAAGIADKLTQIKRMQQDVETYRSQIAVLEAWMKGVNKDESHQTDYPSAAD